jgi:hypothetical protein|nr:MAG: hypothetical protein KatS3mg041_1265 [Bacteroidota bacterium]
MNRWFLFWLPIGILLPALAWAGGPWAPERGKSLWILQYHTYGTARWTDASGRARAYPYGGRYQARSALLYVEYGLGMNWTLEAYLPLAWQLYRDSTGYEQRYSSLRDQELALRRLLWREGGWLFALRGSLHLPWGYNPARDPAAGYGRYGVGISGLLGIGHPGFWAVVELGGRSYGSAGMQLRAEAIAGMHLKQRLRLWVQTSMLYAPVGGDEAPSLSPWAQVRQTVVKLSPTVAWQLSEGLTVQLSWDRDLYSRRSALGTGWRLGMWWQP